MEQRAIRDHRAESWWGAGIMEQRADWEHGSLSIEILVTLKFGGLLRIRSN